MEYGHPTCSRLLRLGSGVVTLAAERYIAGIPKSRIALGGPQHNVLPIVCLCCQNELVNVRGEIDAPAKA